MDSLLANVNSCQVISEPFPHLVLTDVLPEDTCRRLTAEFPPVNVITADTKISTNHRYSLSASKALDNPGVSPLWRELVHSHTSADFFIQVMKLFGSHIRRLYPSLESSIGKLAELRTGVRYLDENPDADVLLDAQLCINTPVVRVPSSVRRAHVDSPNKLFTGLYYLRHPDDKSTGGDLEICKLKGAPDRFELAEIDDRYVEPVTTVKYRPNTLVMFINGIRAIHGVTERGITPFPRYLFNLVGELKQPLFDLHQYQRNKAKSHLLYKFNGLRQLIKRTVSLP